MLSSIYLKTITYINPIEHPNINLPITIAGRFKNIVIPVPTIPTKIEMIYALLLPYLISLPPISAPKAIPNSSTLLMTD